MLIKIIRISTKSSKISVQSIMKNFEIRKSLRKMFRDTFLRRGLLKKEAFEKMIRSSNIF